MNRSETLDSFDLDYHKIFNYEVNAITAIKLYASVN